MDMYVYCCTVHSSKDLEPTQMPNGRPDTIKTYLSKIDWIKKIITIEFTIESYAAIKKDEFMSFAGTWMKLETIILSKLTQEQGGEYYTPGPVRGWRARGGRVGGQGLGEG